MTPEQINVAIAKACGWTAIKNCNTSVGGYCARSPDGYIQYDILSGSEDTAILLNCPNYFSSLDAMHEAEKTLSHRITERGGVSQRDSYVMILGAVMNPKDRDGERSPMSGYQLAHAKAPQKAEAYLKTIDKWEYPKKTT